MVHFQRQICLVSDHPALMSAPAPTIQLAGHIGAFTKLDGGRIRKLVKDEEAKFYSTLADRHLDAEILPYIPKFYGLEEHDGKSTLTLEPTATLHLQLGTVPNCVLKTRQRICCFDFSVLTPRRVPTRRVYCHRRHHCFIQQANLDGHEDGNLQVRN